MTGTLGGITPVTRIDGRAIGDGKPGSITMQIADWYLASDRCAMSEPSKKPDAIDVAILDALQRDGRLSNVALAKAVGLSPTPCAERVRALEGAGIINGYTTNLDPERLDPGLLVFIEIAIDRTSEDAFDQFRKAMLGIAQVQECHMVAGGFDYLLKVRVRDMAAYRAFLGEGAVESAGHSRDPHLRRHGKREGIARRSIYRTCRTDSATRVSTL